MTNRHLHVLHSLDPRGGGPAEGVKQLVAAARTLGVGVEVAVLETPDAAWVSEYDCPVHDLGPSYLKYGYAPRFGSWLKHNSARFAGVVVNGLWQYQTLGTWRALRGSAVPYYVYTHGMLDPWFKREYPLKHLKKLAYWPWAEHRVLRDARAVLFTCEEERRLARESFPRYRANEVVVNYGVPEPSGDPTRARQAFLAQFPHLQGQRFLLFLSRIHPKKGCDLLIRAFAAAVRREPALRLVIAGPDQVGAQRSLMALADQLGVSSSITWTGMIRGDVKTGALRAAEALVLPSHQENFGMVVAEALACGTPVLISDKVNIWREVVEDQAGMVAADTLPGTLALLQRWLDLSPAERLDAARNARACFSRHFHITAAAERLFEALQLSAVTPRRSAA
jgi:glycosyltransferase involved in cell wall biosynthesis